MIVGSLFNKMQRAVAKMCSAKITDVCFYPVRPTSKGLCGFASCLFNNQLALNSISIYTRPTGDGVRCVFPIKVLKTGLTVNLFYPVNDETRKAIENAINC
jgi:DNA-binding cell septation regulator SpoVG